MPEAKPRILIVDDQEDMREALRRLLSVYDASTAVNGEQALCLIEAERPDVVLLDVNMPGMSGLSVLERLEGMENAPVALVLTVNTDMETGIRSLSLGAYAYLTKPFEAERVLEAVAAALEEAARRRAARGK